MLEKSVDAFGARFFELGLPGLPKCCDQPAYQTYENQTDSGDADSMSLHELGAAIAECVFARGNGQAVEVAANVLRESRD